MGDYVAGLLFGERLVRVNLFSVSFVMVIFLPFVRIPVACSLANQPSAFAHYPFVSNTLSSLLSRGVVEECGQRDLHVVSPLGVVPKAQNKLTYLNLLT